MKEFIKDLIIALAIVVAITFVIKPTIVKETSMEPNFQENNYLFVYKLAYITKDHPGYGDVIVFKSNLDKDDGNGKKLLIKRVIAVEGDTIAVQDDKVIRNGKVLDEPYIMDEEFDQGTPGYVEEFTIPEDQVFVMGDHRTVSLDSRESSVGTVSEDAVVGKAVLRVFPFKEFGRIY